MENTATILLSVGDKVSYIPFRGATKYEKGMIKSIPENEDFVFVVFNCNEEWSNYMNYTGQNTKISQLIKGWV